MHRPGVLRIATILTLAVFIACLAPVSAVCADSLRLLTNFEYEINNNKTLDKTDNTTSEIEQAIFSQLYNLDIQKEIFSTLKLNSGGLFDQDSTRTKTADTNVQIGDTRDTAIRPFFDLQFVIPSLSAAAGYRKSEVKEINIDGTTRDFTEEYSARLSWKPVDLPVVDLDFTHSLFYNEPKTNDQEIDNFQLRSRYDFGNFSFSYNHTTNDAVNTSVTGDFLNPINKFRTFTNLYNGVIRFSRSYQQGKVSVSSSLRVNQQKLDFTGDGDRLALINGGSPFYNLSDLTPAANSVNEFIVGSPLTNVNLLSGEVQLSVGLDLGAPGKVEIDTIHVQLVSPESQNDQASPSDVASITQLYSWSVFVSDDQMAWKKQPLTQLVEFDVFENVFKITFNLVKTTFIKVVVTPLPTNTLINKEIHIFRLNTFRTLLPGTSAFSSTDWTGDLSVNWRMTDNTSTGYDVLYREQRSKPFDDKKYLLSTGARLQHKFNDVFVGSMRAQRSQTQDRGEDPSTSHSYSASLSARYLATFDQSLNYSFIHQNDEEARTSIINAVFLRSNIDLYQGWSMFLDNGYSWQNPADGEDTNTTFVRVNSNIVPNRWVNFSLSYGVSWAREAGKTVARDQNCRLVATWVPTNSLSMSADLVFSDEDGAGKDSSAAQRYFINWSPFRNGDLIFSLAYGQSGNDDDEKNWSLSPSLRWQVNRKTLLTLDYARGEREDLSELVEFDNVRLALRIFY